MTEEQERDRDIRIYHNYGYSYMEIADATGASFSDIRKAIKEEKEMIQLELTEAAVPERKRGNRKPTIQPDTKSKVILMYQEGEHNVRKIAETYGISKSSVQKILKDAGIRIKKANIDDVLKKKVINLCKDTDMTQKQIAELCGISVSSVQTIAQGTKKGEPAAAATVTGSEETVQENVSEDIVPPSEENVKTLDDDYCKESEMYDTVAELVKIEIDFLRTQILDFQHDLDRCYHRYELLCEYLKMNGRAVKEDD